MQSSPSIPWTALWLKLAPAPAATNHEERLLQWYEAIRTKKTTVGGRFRINWTSSVLFLKIKCAIKAAEVAKRGDNWLKVLKRLFFDQSLAHAAKEIKTIHNNKKRISIIGDEYTDLSGGKKCENFQEHKDRVLKMSAARYVERCHHHHHPHLLCRCVSD
uniref:Uncharacterized protein n=1 Tax=Glossina pallidipes TaxID=7398 RepID=A0A1A9ZIT3_GLOPL